jgi:hypothetical protein
MIKIYKLAAIIFLYFYSLSANIPLQKRTQIFSFHADLSDSLIVNQLVFFAEEARLRCEKFFNYHLKDNIDIYLAPSNEDYKKYNPPEIPEWSGGVAFMRRRAIILKPGAYYDPLKYRETLSHEIAHFYIGDIIKGNALPVWLNEGTAMYLSGKSVSWQESINIGNALSVGNLTDLTAIDTVLKFANAQAELAYIESFLAVQFIIGHHGEKAIADIIKDFSYTNNIDHVMKKHLGYDFIDFEIDWYDYLKRHYRWMAFLQFENLFWFLLVVIIIFAFIMKKIRNRKIYREWEQENLLQ